MDIQTKDGILLRNIPDGTPEETIKARINAIRQERGLSAPQATQPEIPASPSLIDVATGPATMGDWASGRVQAAKDLATPEYWKGIVDDLTKPVRVPRNAEGKLDLSQVEGPPISGDEKANAISMALSAMPTYGMGKVARAAILKAPVQNEGLKKIAQELSKEGLTIPISHVRPGGVNSVLESLGGKTMTEQKMSLNNREMINKLAKRAIGISDDSPLTDDVLNGIKKKAGETYETLKQAGTFSADKQFAKELADAGGGYRAFVKEFPELANKEVDNLLAAFNKPQMSANGLVEGVKKLRFDAGKNMKSMDPDKVALGRVQRNITEAVEDLMERNLSKRGMKDIMDKFRAGRQKYAIASTIQEGLDDAGNVSSTAVAKMMDKFKGKTASKEMGIIAKMGANFPKAAQDIKRSMLPGSPLDWALGGSLSAITEDPKYMALLAVRPAARALISSKPYQKMMLNNSPNIGNAPPDKAYALARLLAAQDQR